MILTGLLYLQAVKVVADPRIELRHEFPIGA
jgi:hypothetical protein